MIKLLCNSINTYMINEVVAADSIEVKKNSLTLLFRMQNNKLEEYKEILNNTRYTKLFPKYYKKFCRELFDKLYIDIEE